MSKTTELDKMHEARETLRTQEIGEFLDWLHGQKIVLARRQAHRVLLGWEHEQHCPEVPDEYETVRDARKGKNPPVLIKDLAPTCCEAEECWKETNEEDLFLHHESIETLLARYSGVDLNKVEDEKQAILNDLRAKT